MTSNIDWSLHSSIVRRKLLILSTKKIKQLCKSFNIQYSVDKLQTINDLIETKKLSMTNNETKTNTDVNVETKETDTITDTHTNQNTNETKQNLVLKVAILGDRQVGIRTLMVRYIEGKYDEEYTDSLGINFMEKTIHLRYVNVTISIWYHRWHSDNMSLVCSDAKVIIFAFDLTHKNTLFSVKRYYKESRKVNKYFRPFLVGTKYDLFAKKDKDYKLDITKQARKFASKMQSPLIYCSAAHGINIRKIFKLIVAKCFDLKPKMKEIYNVNEAIFEWNSDRRKTEMICIVFGYIRQVQREFKWNDRMDIYEFVNIILLFYGNIVIGGHNKEYKIQSRIHKKLQKNLRKLERKKLAQQRQKQKELKDTCTICVETENKENVS